MLALTLGPSNPISCFLQGLISDASGIGYLIHQGQQTLPSMHLAIVFNIIIGIKVLSNLHRTWCLELVWNTHITMLYSHNYWHWCLWDYLYESGEQDLAYGKFTGRLSRTKILQGSFSGVNTWWSSQKGGVQKPHKWGCYALNCPESVVISCLRCNAFQHNSHPWLTFLICYHGAPEFRRRQRLLLELVTTWQPWPVTPKMWAGMWVCQELTVGFIEYIASVRI